MAAQTDDFYERRSVNSITVCKTVQEKNNKNTVKGKKTEGKRPINDISLNFYKSPVSYLLIGTFTTTNYL